MPKRLIEVELDEVAQNIVHIEEIEDVILDYNKEIELMNSPQQDLSFSEEVKRKPVLYETGR